MNVAQVDEMKINVVQMAVLEIVFVRCDVLEIKINNLFGKHMLLCKTTSFIYMEECSVLAKSIFNCVDCLNAFDFQGEYFISEALLGCC